MQKLSNKLLKIFDLVFSKMIDLPGILFVKLLINYQPFKPHNFFSLRPFSCLLIILKGKTSRSQDPLFDDFKIVEHHWYFSDFLLYFFNFFDSTPNSSIFEFFFIFFSNFCCYLKCVSTLISCLFVSPQNPPVGHRSRLPWPWLNVRMMIWSKT